MRSVFYQNAGNPIQQDRVPKGIKPTFEIAVDLPSLRSSLPAIFRWLMISFAVQLFVIFWRSLGIDWFEPTLTAIAWGTLGVYAVRGILRRSAEEILCWRCLAAALVICMSSSTPLSVAFLLNIAAFGWFAFRFSDHWVTLSTTAPVPLEECQRLRKIGRLTSLAVVTVACLVYFWPYFGIAPLEVPVIWLGLTTAFGIGTAIVCRTPFDALTFPWMMARSWFTYASGHAPGVCTSPAGSRQNRKMLLLVPTTLLLIGPHATGTDAERLIWALWAWALKGWCIESASGEVTFEISQGSWLLLNLGVNLSYLTINMAAMIVVAFIINAPVLQWITWSTYRWRKSEADVLASRNSGNEPDGQTSEISESNSPECPFGFGKPIPVKERYFKNITQPAGQPYNQYLLRLRDRLREGNEIERDSMLLGSVVLDQSPVLFPKSALKGHAHMLGGFGKPRPYGLVAPFIEQLADQGDCSVVVLDMEGSSPELFASLNAVRAFVQDKTGRPPLLDFFSADQQLESQAFNPFTQPFWKELSAQCQSDLLVSAMGLAYSIDGREGYSSTASRSFSDQGARRQPESFVELLEALQVVAKSAKRHGLNSEVIRAGSQVLELLKRLARVEALNVTANSGHDKTIQKHAIRLESVLQKPRLAYFHLPSTHEGSTSSTIGRLVVELLLEAAARSKPKHPVYLVINEFQRMLMGNLQQVLMRAKHLGIRVILVNQVLDDLRTRGVDLVPTIEACCRTQIWASVHAREDQERIMASSGVTVEQRTTKGWSWNLSGQFTRTWSTTEETVPIIINNDLNLMNDHPQRYLLKLRSGHGYAQYGGMPVIFESDYHVIPDEYERRQVCPWPVYVGSFLPRAAWQEELISTLPPTILPGIGPWSQETIGGRQSKHEVTDIRSVQSEMLSALLSDLESADN